MTPKSLNCRLCGASFVPEFKNQEYCKVCLDYKWNDYDNIKKENGTTI